MTGSLGPLDCCTPVPVEAALPVSDSRLLDRELAKSKSSNSLETPLWVRGEPRARSARGLPADRAAFLRPAGSILPSTNFVHSATAADAAALKLATSAGSNKSGAIQQRNWLPNPGRGSTRFQGRRLELGGTHRKKARPLCWQWALPYPGRTPPTNPRRCSRPAGSPSCSPRLWAQVEAPRPRMPR